MHARWVFKLLTECCFDWTNSPSSYFTFLLVLSTSAVFSAAWFFLFIVLFLSFPERKHFSRIRHVVTWSKISLQRRLVLREVLFESSLFSGQLSRFNDMYALLKCGQRNKKWRPAGHQKSREGSQKFVLKRSLRLLLKSPLIDSASKKSRKVKLSNFTPLLSVINAFCTLIEKNQTIKHSSIASVVKII